MLRVQRTPRDRATKNKKHYLMCLMVMEDMVGRIIPSPFPPKDVHPLFPRTYEYVTLWPKGFADVTGIKGFVMGSLSWVIWVGPS